MLVKVNKSGDAIKILRTTIESFKKTKSYLLSNYPDIAKKSGVTMAPIKYVPYLILYVNGRPWLRWDNEKTLAAMVNFLKDIIPRIPKNLVENSSSNGANKGSAEEKPVFQGGGIPYNVVCDKSSGVCYLSFEDFRNSARQ